MIGSEDRDEPSAPVLGKELTIIVVVVFSSLSFTLGFFVGKSVQEKKESSLRSAVDNVTHQAPSDAQTVQPLPSAPLSQKSPQTEGKTPGGEQPKSSEKVEPLVPNVSQDASKTESSASSLSTNPQKVKVPVQKEAAGPQRALSAQQSSLTDTKPPISDDEIYTVQLGALKSESQAKRFKAKYDKKGYKTYIIVSKDSKNVKVYKIRAGQFRQKSDAELLSEKIRKVEGLETFVTTKNE